MKHKNIINNGNGKIQLTMQVTNKYQNSTTITRGYDPL